MSWVDTAEGAAGAVGAMTGIGLIVRPVLKPWLKEVVASLNKAAAGAEVAAANSQTLKENGGSSLKDKANIAADSSLRTEAKVDRLVERFDEHMIQAARKEAVLDYQIAELRQGRLPVVTVQQQLPPGATIHVPEQ